MKKTQTKKKSVEEKVKAPDQTFENNMNEEEFERYIDSIMADDADESSAPEEVAPDEVQAENEDIISIKEQLGTLSAAVNDLVKLVGLMGADKAGTAQTQEQTINDDMATKAQMYDRMMKKKLQDEAVKRRLFDQEADIRKLYGDFDLRVLYNTHPLFRAELERTGSVYGAYLKYLADKLSTADNGALRRSFLENGVMPNLSAGSVSTSPAGLPDKEFDEYIRNILGQN